MPNPSTRRDIRSLAYEELVEVVARLGQPAFRAKQLNEWLFEKQVFSFDEMTNLPKTLRSRLAEKFCLAPPQELARQLSRDGSRKYLLAFADGANVEAVGMPTRNKLTACISTQAGCAIACAFCATGGSGFARNLSAQEMLDQVSHIARDFNERVTSVVCMGQGEPFLNFDAVVSGLHTLNTSPAFGIGARHLTVSTCGIIPGIHRFAKLGEQFTLAVSLHSAVQETRNRLMPGVKKYTLVRLYEALRAYTEETKRRPTYEFALIDGVNDTKPEMEALLDFCVGTLCHVNLIQLNATTGCSLRPSPADKLERLQRLLASHGVETTIRISRGQDIDAACGQLKQRTF